MNYIVYWDQGSDDYLPLVTTDANTLSYVKTTGLTTGNLYKFKVSAANAIGESNQSEPALEVLAARVPGAPTDIESVTASSGHITFDWTAPYDGGSDINFYKIYWNQGPTVNTFDYLASTPDPVNSFTINHSLNPGDAY